MAWKTPDEWMSDAEILARAAEMRDSGDLRGLLYLNTVLLVSLRANTAYGITRDPLGVAGVEQVKT